MNKKQKEEMREWAQNFDKCAVCHWPVSDFRRRMEVHHLIGGGNRAKSHHPKAYLALCSRCHGVYHSGQIVAHVPDIDMGILLEAKREADPENYDPEFLASLRNKKHLGHDPKPIPKYFIEERTRNLKWKTRNP